MKHIKLILFILILSIVSCIDEHGGFDSTPYERIYGGFEARAVILENSTVTYCTLNSTQLNTLRVKDTVWLDVVTHTISDTSHEALRAVLYNQ